MNNGVSTKEAFAAMSLFLERYYRRTGSDDIGSLLGDIQFVDGNRTADPAAWHEWLECVTEARQEAQRQRATSQEPTTY